MGKEKSLTKVLSGLHDRNLSFRELLSAAEAAGFRLDRVVGDHHIYVKDGVPEIINLQPGKNGAAKPYQVKQVRQIITNHHLGGE